LISSACTLVLAHVPKERLTPQDGIHDPFARANLQHESVGRVAEALAQQTATGGERPTQRFN
jgi:hypothetical protein